MTLFHAPCRLSRQRAQGVVEYAGALVVCAILIGAAMSVAPYNMQEVFDQVTARVITIFMTP
jgi:hypothetical protein